MAETKKKTRSCDCVDIGDERVLWYMWKGGRIEKDKGRRKGE